MSSLNEPPLKGLSVRRFEYNTSANKWKCSLWLEDEAGEPVMVSSRQSHMQDCQSHGPHANVSKVARLRSNSV